MHKMFVDQAIKQSIPRSSWYLRCDTVTPDVIKVLSKYSYVLDKNLGWFYTKSHYNDIKRAMQAMRECKPLGCSFHLFEVKNINKFRNEVL